MSNLGKVLSGETTKSYGNEKEECRSNDFPPIVLRQY